MPEASESEATTSKPVAAIDLGSNSFHLIVATWNGRRLKTVDRRKEMVRIAGGLDDHRNLTEEASERALQTLSRFGQAVANIPSDNVRAVGTNTFRAMQEPRPFLRRAEKALGHPIEIVSGCEEARLIYSGVAHERQPIDGHQLVVDVGGGSTECAVGQRFDPISCHSLRMGCVTYTQGFFPGGKINGDRFQGAMFAATNELQPVRAQLNAIGWERAIGASGTILAVEAVLAKNGWCEGRGVTLDGLEKLRKAALDAGHVDDLDLSGLSERRRPVFIGGLAIVEALMRTLGIEHLYTSAAALREGVLRDLVGRFEGDDLRNHTVDRVQERYGADVAQARRVIRRLESLWEAAADDWDLTDAKWLRITRWAAALHEIGLSIAYSGHHKHGAYLLEHIDMPGFSRAEQALLAALVLCHRRKFRHEALSDAVRQDDGVLAVRSGALLRLAVLLERGRGRDARPEVGLEVDGSNMKISLVDAAREDHPLTLADLAAEADRLDRADLDLAF